MKFKGQEDVPAAKALTLAVFHPKLPPPVMTDDALALRDKLVSEAREVGGVVDAASNKLAGDTVVALRKQVKAVQTARLEHTGPLNEVVKQLIQIERDWCDPVLEEIQRLEASANKFQAAEEERARKAEQERQAELRRLQEKQAEEAAKLQQAATPRQEKVAERKYEQATTALDVALRTPAAVAAPARVKGQTSRMENTVRIVDPKKAYAANPHFFDLVPKLGVIKQCAVPGEGKDELNPERTLYPGIECWWTKKTTFRS